MDSAGSPDSMVIDFNWEPAILPAVEESICDDSTDSTFGGLNFKKLVAECSTGPSSSSHGGPFHPEASPRKVKLPSHQVTVIKSSSSKRRMGTVEKVVSDLVSMVEKEVEGKRTLKKMGTVEKVVNDLVSRVEKEVEGKMSNRKKGRSITCCYGVCLYDTRYPEKHPVKPTKLFFVPFPQMRQLKEDMTEHEINTAVAQNKKAERWLKACGRGLDLTDITYSMHICSEHFIGAAGPSKAYPDPIPANLTDKHLESLASSRKKQKVATRAPGKAKKRRSRKEIEERVAAEDITMEYSIGSDLLDSMYSEESDHPAAAQLSTSFETQHSNVFSSSFLNDETSAPMMETPMMEVSNIINQDDSGDSEDGQDVEKKDKVVRTKTTLNPVPVLSDSPFKDLGKYSYHEVTATDKTCKLFLGLTRAQLDVLINFLSPDMYNLRYYRSTANPNSKVPIIKQFNVKEQLMITLIRLRRGTCYGEMAHRYSCSIFLISQIVTTWVQFMFYAFKEVMTLPHRSLLQDDRPRAFVTFKHIRASIDATEFRCQMPKDFGEQGNKFSNYKHSNTFKCLIAVTPHGAAGYVSDLWEGSVDDVTMFEKCGILQKVDEGDSFLVDKGFTIQHLLVSKQATIFIPPFLGKRSAFTKEELVLTARIARARIHVERFNDRLKKFRLLSNVIPLDLAPIASQLVFVCSALVNFQEYLCTS